MTSPPRRDKIPNDLEWQEKSPMSVLNKLSPNRNISFTETISFDDIDLQKTSSQISSIYLETCNTAPSLTYEGECFGDSQTPRSVSSSKTEKEILLFGENFMKQSFSKPTITINKAIHIDIAPEDDCNKNDDALCDKDLQHIHEIHVFKNKFSVENRSCLEVVESKSSRKIHSIQTQEQKSLPQEIRRNGSKEQCTSSARNFDYSENISSSSDSLSSHKESALKAKHNLAMSQSKLKQVSPVIKKVSQGDEDLKTGTQGQKYSINNIHQDVCDNKKKVIHPPAELRYDYLYKSPNVSESLNSPNESILKIKRNSKIPQPITKLTKLKSPYQVPTLVKKITLPYEDQATLPQRQNTAIRAIQKDAYDNKVRYSSRRSRFEYSHENLGTAVNSPNESILKVQHNSALSNSAKLESSQAVSPRMQKVIHPFMPEDDESCSGKEGLNIKDKRGSKLKINLLGLFLSCGKFCM